MKEFRLLNHLYVMFIVILSFVLFNAADLHEAFSDIINMFGMGHLLTGFQILKFPEEFHLLISQPFHFLFLMTF